MTPEHFVEIAGPQIWVHDGGQWLFIVYEIAPCQTAPKFWKKAAISDMLWYSSVPGIRDEVMGHVLESLDEEYTAKALIAPWIDLEMIRRDKHDRKWEDGARKSGFGQDPDRNIQRGRGAVLGTFFP